jgi:hypothetical protein
MIEPLAGQLVVRNSRDLAHSALPASPVRHEPEPAPAPARPLRRRTAVALRHLADRLDGVVSRPAVPSR